MCSIEVGKKKQTQQQQVETKQNKELSWKPTLECFKN